MMDQHRSSTFKFTILSLIVSLLESVQYIAFLFHELYFYFQYIGLDLPGHYFIAL